MANCESSSVDGALPSEIGAKETIYRYVSSPTAFVGEAGLSPVAFMLFRKNEKDVSVERGDGLALREVLEHGKMINMWAATNDRYCGAAKMIAENIMAIDGCDLVASPSERNPRHAGIILHKKDGTVFVNKEKITADIPIPDDINLLLLQLTKVVDKVYDKDENEVYSANDTLDLSFENFIGEDNDLVEGIVADE